MSNTPNEDGHPVSHGSDKILEEEIEILEEEIEILEEEIEASGKHPERPTATVHIENADDGDTIRIRVPFRVTVGDVIDRMYVKIGVPYAAGDRLTIQPGGGDVFGLRPETIREYVHSHGDKASIHWRFAGDTGGA